jgi:hypothetical protein
LLPLTTHLSIPEDKITQKLHSIDSKSVQESREIDLYHSTLNKYYQRLRRIPTALIIADSFFFFGILPLDANKNTKHMKELKIRIRKHKNSQETSFLYIFFVSTKQIPQKD